MLCSVRRCAEEVKNLRSLLAGISGVSRRLVILMLVDAVLWGVWFGSMWMFRPALASRLGESYTEVNLMVSLPLLVAAAVQYAAGSSKRCREFIRRYRLQFMRFSSLVTRPMNLAIALVLYWELFEPRTMLYTVTAMFTLSNAVGALGGVAWSDYAAANIPRSFRAKYAGLDAMFSNIGTLGGTVLAGYLLSASHEMRNYGEVFLVGSALFMIGLPIPFLLVETGIEEAELRKLGRKALLRDVDRRKLFAAISLAIFAVNLPMSVVVPYIMRVWGGDEAWVAVINASSWLASIFTPMMWSYLVEKLGSLKSACISIGIGVTMNALFPFLPTVELQGIRAFIAGAAFSGIWVTLFSFLIRDVDPGNRILYSSRMFALQNAVPAISMTVGATIADITRFPELVFWLSVLGLASIPTLLRTTMEISEVSQVRTYHVQAPRSRT